MMPLNVLVTGGAGFIGSALCRYLLTVPNVRVVVLDKLTYAGNVESLGTGKQAPNYRFVKGDICHERDVLALMQAEQIHHVMHLAAETHVDRSIEGPGAFIETNIVGTFRLLETARTYWQSLPETAARHFRFHHISTDEVFGDLPFDGSMFHEGTPYAPSSPYSASKASADHLVRAWHHTFGLPVVLSNCSNNYGPFHFPEKLIPLVILNALDQKPLPVYGTGSNVRDWLYVEDHARALARVASHGAIGESYNIGGHCERSNLVVVETICEILDRLHPRSKGSYRNLITFVSDRPGHDRRYAIDTGKIEKELSWKPVETFESGIEKTVRWFLENEWWWRPIREGVYDGQRLGRAVGSR